MHAGVQACEVWKVWDWEGGAVQKILPRVHWSCRCCISCHASKAESPHLVAPSGQTTCMIVDLHVDSTPKSLGLTINTALIYCPINTLLVCSCKCESYLSLVRHWNVYSNQQAPSRDIADAFMKLEHLRFVCSGGLLDERRSDCAYLPISYLLLI